ncbi:MAG: 2-phosphoglycerate kinase [Deinococcaceae bacterium]
MREIFVSSGKHRWPFSKGLVIESLINADIEETVAIAIARSVEQHLLDHNTRLVSPESLKALVAQYTERLAGLSTGQRFEEQTSTFEDITVTEGQSRIPFSRGILARSLEALAFTPKRAHALAKEVDRQLRQKGIHRISVDELEQLVAQTLNVHEGEGVKNTYLNRYATFGGIEVYEDRPLVSFPFSKGILAQSLLATGLEPAYAHRVARETEMSLREQGQTHIARSHLATLVENILRQEVGGELADRYHVLRAIRRPEKPVIVLIGGVTGTGKSHLAAELSYRLGITRTVSSDSVREVMRAMISPALVPTLHSSTFMAWKAYFPESDEYLPSSDTLLQGFREQAQQVSLGLEAIIRRSIEEHTNAVIEGVHIMPHHLMSFHFPGAVTVPMLVAALDEEEHRSHFYLRDQETQQHRPMQRYLKHFRDIRHIQDHLIEHAQRKQIPILDGLALDRATDGAIEIIIQKILQPHDGAHT